MPLFNRKTIAQHIGSNPSIREEHREALEAWAEMIRSNHIYSLKETALHGEFTAKVVEGVLGYRGPSSGPDYTVAAELAIARGIVDLALGRFGEDESEILATFELKGAATRNLDAIMPGRNRSPVQQAWDYAVGAPGVKWVLISNYVELRLYGFGEGTAAYEDFALDRLTEPGEYARFMLLLSAESLLSGRTLDLLSESRQADKDITDSLYQDYKTLRLQMIDSIETADSGIERLAAISVAQKVLDRTLFIAFAEDTGLLPKNTLSDAFTNRDRYNPRPVWDNFKGLFRAIDEGSLQLNIPPYNGGLFRHDDVIEALQFSDEICASLKEIGDYDFASEVSVTILGHIFEQSVSDVERLQAIARGEDENEAVANGRRKRDGVVYTPDYVARFIVAQTLGAHLDEIFNEILEAHARPGADLSDYGVIRWRKKSSELDAWCAYRDRIRSLRIVDPACGSGVFLIMAFDFMKAELERVKDKITDLENKGPQAALDDLITPDSDILANNLFGVDVNLESVEITKLSLWIRTARRGKALDNLSDNIRVGDSLIEDSSFAYLEHGFNWADAFPGVFEEGGFDVVLGNPPYVRMELLTAIKPYLERRYEVVSDRADLYCYFYERGLRLLKSGGRLGYISSNTFFKTGSGRPLREYLLREATIEGVVDFGDLQIFEGVTTYPAILIMRKTAVSDAHELRFWKVNNLAGDAFQTEWENAAGPYPQGALGSGSWEFEEERLRLLREKIRAGRRTLKEVYGSPLYGIKTGLNAAFVIDTPTKERLCAEDPISAELLKPVLKGNDLKRWHVESEGWWLIYTPKNRIDIEGFPAIRDWLLPFRERLEKRATKQEWFELQQDQLSYVPGFEAEGICFPDMSQGPKFSISPPGNLYETTTFKIKAKDFMLLALLNSRLFWFCLRGEANALRGGEWRLRLKRQYIEPLPIPKCGDRSRIALAAAADKASKLALNRQELQTAFIRRIPDLCPPEREPKLSKKLLEWWTLPDFAAFRRAVKRAFKTDIPLSERSDWEDWITRDRKEIERLSSDIVQLERQIDEIVYGLFELTPSEINLLEEATSAPSDPIPKKRAVANDDRG